jgi:hypothetical protein
MPDFTYKKQEIQRRLEALPSLCRVAFGLSCCERLLPNYVACKQKIAWGDERPLRSALDEAWKHIEGQVLDESKTVQLLAACEVVAPNSDDFSELLTTSAQDACFSICCVLEYILHGDIEQISQVSSFAVDTLDLYVAEMLDGFPNIQRGVPYSSEREERIRLHPLMQRELARQDADLKLLAGNPDLKSLKSLWRAPSKSNIDL